MLVGDFFGQKADLLLAVRSPFIAQLTCMSTQTITQFPLYFCEVRRDDLISDGQSRQRGPSPLLGDFARAPDLASEERASVGM
jgi:hypothetical protein